MNVYTIKNILDDESIRNLKSCYEEITPLFAHQDYNLFDLEKRNVSSKIFQKYKKDFLKIHKIGEEKNLTSMNSYFLKYEKDSFTRLHRDDENIVKLTIVTLIETSNLVGGETLILNRYGRKSRPKHKYAKRTEKAPPYDKDIIPTIVDLKDGESVIYDAKVLHGVTKVTEGHRIVLVTWFK